jgi:2-haloalkanoic acid dehalogenase type II
MTQLTSIKTISFDIDGTLSDFEKVMWSALGVALLEFERFHPEAVTTLTIEGMIQTRERVHSELKASRMSLEEIRFHAFRRTLQDVGVHDYELACHLTQVYMKHRFNSMKPFNDVLPTLDALRQRHVIGLLSNGNSRPEFLGLGDVFKFAVFAENHGVEKPDPRIFQVMVDMGCCSPAEVIHVGDSLEDDIAGAASAGIRSVWLNRNDIARDSRIPVEYEISSLTELIDILEDVA